MGKHSWKTVCHFLKKLNRITIDQAILFLNYISSRIERKDSKEILVHKYL